MSGSLAPVIAGIAGGIIFVVLFSFFFGSGAASIVQPLDAAMTKNKHDDWLSQTAYNLPEVKAFREKYGQVGATGHSISELEGIRICYTYPATPCESQFDHNLKAYLEVTLDGQAKPLMFVLWCYSDKGMDHLLGTKIDVAHFLETSEYCQK